MSIAVAVAVGSSIGPLLVAATGATRNRAAGRWARHAEELARKSDIALPEAIRPSVIKHLYRRYLLTLLQLPLVVVLVSVVASEDADWKNLLPAMVALSSLLPMAQALLTLGLSRWPRLSTATLARVTHLERPNPVSAFARHEQWALALGVAVTFTAGPVGLDEAGAKGYWWTLFLLGNIIGVSVALMVGYLVMNRPSSASNQLELGWDDVFRYRDVRALFIGSIWMTAGLVLFLTWNGYYGATHSNEISFLPTYALIGLWFLVGRVFRGGATQWRTAWQPQESYAGQNLGRK